MFVNARTIAVVIALFGIMMLSPALMAQNALATVSPTPFPSPTPSPTPTPTPPPNCTNPLQSLDPVVLQLDPTVEDGIMPPTDTSDPELTSYIIAADLSSAYPVGVVLPAYGGYTISPNATTTADPSYDVSGCWGPNGAMVFAEPGVYSFLALGSPSPSPSPTPIPTSTAAATVSSGPVGAIGPGILVALGLAARTDSYCLANPATLARAAAVNYPPLGATVAGGETGLMTDDTNDRSIMAGLAVFRSIPLQVKLIGGGAATAVADMVTNIGTVFTNNGNNQIVAVEAGHGGPSTWTNVGSTFSLNLGTTPPTPSDALRALETGANGKIDTFDVFSCTVAKTLNAGGNLNANHILTHLASNLVAGRGQAKTRGVNVPIHIIQPVGRRAGSFAVKNVDPDARIAVTGTVTCNGPAPPTCTLRSTTLIPAP